MCYFLSCAVKVAVEGAEEEEEHQGMDGSAGEESAKPPVQSVCSSQHEDAGTGSLSPELQLETTEQRQTQGTPAYSRLSVRHLGQHRDPPVSK